ncbi:hypothetical protein BUE76_21955 [Cnuella takakiae]|nr:hypothetical protein BUE76_21955 [Cnuella takakiae]
MYGNAQKDCGIKRQHPPTHHSRHNHYQQGSPYPSNDLFRFLIADGRLPALLLSFFPVFSFKSKPSNPKPANLKAATLSRLMRLSREIQRKQECSRSRSLFAAWAILQNKDTTIFRLVRPSSHSH